MTNLLYVACANVKQFYYVSFGYIHNFMFVVSINVMGTLYLYCISLCCCEFAIEIGIFL